MAGATHIAVAPPLSLSSKLGNFWAQFGGEEESRRAREVDGRTRPWAWGRLTPDGRGRRRTRKKSHERATREGVGCGSSKISLARPRSNLRNGIHAAARCECTRARAAGGVVAVAFESRVRNGVARIALNNRRGDAQPGYTRRNERQAARLRERTFSELRIGAGRNFGAFGSPNLRWSCRRRATTTPEPCPA